MILRGINCDRTQALHTRLNRTADVNLHDAEQPGGIAVQMGIVVRKRIRLEGLRRLRVGRHRIRSRKAAGFRVVGPGAHVVEARVALQPGGVEPEVSARVAQGRVAAEGGPSALSHNDSLSPIRLRCTSVRCTIQAPSPLAGRCTIRAPFTFELSRLGGLRISDCFGAFQVNPWITAALDGAVFFLAAWGFWKSPV